MTKDGVRGEVVGGMHEMGLCRRALSSSAYAGLRIADDTVGNVDQTRLKQGRKCEDDRSGIASGVGNEAGLPDLAAMQFGATVGCFGLQFCGKLGVGIFQTVDGPIDVLL